MKTLRPVGNVLSPFGVVAEKPLVGLRMVALELVQPPLPPLAALGHQFLVTLRVRSLQFRQALLNPGSVLGHQGSEGLRVVLFQPFKPTTPVLPELAHHPLVGFWVGVFQMRQSLPELGFLVLNRPLKRFRVFLLEPSQPCGFLSEPLSPILSAVTHILATIAHPS